MNSNTIPQQVIDKAAQVMKANGMKFATIWKTGNSFGFNFESKPVGYREKEFGVKRTVVHVIEA